MNINYYLINAQWNNNPVLETTILNVYTTADLRKFKNIYYPHNPPPLPKKMYYNQFICICFIIVHQIPKFYSNIDRNQVYS